MFATRLSFSLDALQRYAVSLLLDQEVQYRSDLAARLAERYPAPTPAQSAASQDYIAYHIASFDPSQIIAAMPAPPADISH